MLKKIVIIFDSGIELSIPKEQLMVIGKTLINKFSKQLPTLEKLIEKEARK